jgi:hypothetical protein
MQSYVVNRNCACWRCKWNGLTGPAVLVTVGVLMLLSNLHAAPFHRTWPAILIAIGVVKLLQTAASTEGHRAPGASAPPPVDPLAAPLGAPEASRE